MSPLPLSLIHFLAIYSTLGPGVGLTHNCTYLTSANKTQKNFSFFLVLNADDILT